MKKIYLTLSLFLIGLTLTAQKLPFQGYLEESGVPVNGTRTFNFELPDYGWTETIADVPIDNGIYNVVLGEITLLPDSIFSNVSETPLSIMVDSTNIGTVTIYKPLINGTSLAQNGESIKVKNSTGNLRGEFLPLDNGGQLRLFGTNDSIKSIIGGNYGGRFFLYDSLGSVGASLRVTNKGLGNLYTYNENHTNVGWFGGYGNDGFVQLVSYDETDTQSGAVLLGSFADGKYPQVYLEGTAQQNFGLANLKVDQLPDGEETASLQINKSNGGGEARLSIFQDDAGADPTGVSANLDLFADSSPNFIFGSAGWEDHDLANMSAYGSIADGTGWYYSAIELGVSKTGDGTQEFGFLNFQNNLTGASNNTLSLNGNINETGAGGIELLDSTATARIILNGADGNISSNRASNGGSAINLFQGNGAGGISIQDANDIGRFFFGAGEGIMRLRNDVETETARIESQTGNIVVSGTVTAQGTVLTSDKRFKKEINTLENSLSNTLKLRGTSYYWKDENKTQRKQIGVIAQEVEEVYPEFVHTNEDGYKAVNYSQMTAVLIEAIKELNAKVESLEEENETLTAALDQTKVLSEKIDKLEKLLLQEQKVASK